MNTIGEILKKKIIDKKEGSKKINIAWEEANEFANYVGLKTTFVLMLFKNYGKQRVLSLRSYLKDASLDKKKLPGLAIWRLKKIND